MAEVTAIEECPPIAGGSGSVVIAAIVTSNARELVRAVFADGEELVGTDLHPVWNFTRQDWTPLGKLVPGDYVLADGIPLAVRSVTQLTADEPVYNLEVHGQHVYEAGASGVLVHNTDAACEAYKKALKELEDLGDKDGMLKLARERLEVLKATKGKNPDELKQLKEIKKFLDKNGKTRWDYIRAWHDKRATDLFGKGEGRSVGGRVYDKKFAGRDIEYKSNNFKKGPVSQESLDRMKRQIAKDIANAKKGRAKPHWHFEHDPRLDPQMAPLLRLMKNTGITWTWGSKTPVL